MWYLANSHAQEMECWFPFPQTVHAVQVDRVAGEHRSEDGLWALKAEMVPLTQGKGFLMTVRAWVSGG